MFKYTEAEEIAQDRAERAEADFAAEGIVEPGLSPLDFSAEALAEAEWQAACEAEWLDSMFEAADHAAWDHMTRFTQAEIDLWN